MDGHPISTRGGRFPRPPRRWISHARHDVPGMAPHATSARPRRTSQVSQQGLVVLDGSQGEGGGQILRTALTLSLLTGRPFTINQLRANREKPGLRPQHMAAVEAAALLGEATVEGAVIGARELTFRPRPYTPRDLDINIGTAGATGLVLQTLHLPLALRSDRAVRLTLSGGTFNLKAPSFPFLETTWRSYLAAMGLPISLAMPQTGFFPRGGGRLDVWIEPAQPSPITLLDRGPLVRIRGVAGTANLHRNAVGERMRERAEARLAFLGLPLSIEVAEWHGPSPGAAISLTAEHTDTLATFVGLGALGKPAESVADEAVDELLTYQEASGAVDAHSADQLLLPLALAEGGSVYTVAEITDHLQTNVDTIRAFLDRPIRIEKPEGDRPGRIVIA
jgi:RNA 3'-terminal phosphate cyclase (ATP)